MQSPGARAVGVRASRPRPRLSSAGLQAAQAGLRAAHRRRGPPGAPGAGGRWAGGGGSGARTQATPGAGEAGTLVGRAARGAAEPVTPGRGYGRARGLGCAEGGERRYCPRDKA